MKKLLFVIMAVVVLMTACHVRGSKDVKTERFENNVAYFQDQNTGAVFAIVAIKKPTGTMEEGIGMAYIPKAEVTPEIKKQIKNYKEW